MQKAVRPEKGVPEDPRPEIRNGRWEVKDSSLWGAHDPAVYRDPDSGKYYAYCTHNHFYRSDDLIHWKEQGKIVKEMPQEVVSYVHGDDLWAPDIIKVGEEYRMYCSASTFGVCRSALFLAVSDRADGPFEYRGTVIKTSDEISPVNAIDACIVTEDIEAQNMGNIETQDAENAGTADISGTAKDKAPMYLVYGSFWGGIHMLPLDPLTGLLKKETESDILNEDGILKDPGICICRRPSYLDGAVEGPYIRYNRQTGYYYLFVSYGSLNSDYNIRVGRSRRLQGPYLDVNGRDLAQPDAESGSDAVDTGLMIAAGFQFGSGSAYMAPGHNSVLEDTDGNWYLVCHIRPRNFYGFEISTMRVWPMLWTRDGWPAVSPSPYAGEKKGAVSSKDLIGVYDRITLKPDLLQGCSSSFPMALLEEGTVEAGSLHGKWKMEGDDGIEVSFGPYEEHYKALYCFNEDEGKPGIMLTGQNEKGLAVWARQKN